MSDDTPFAAENPFKKLDKKRFQPAPGSKEAVLAATKKKHSKQGTSAEASFSEQFSSPDAQQEAHEFLSAVSGVTRFDKSAKAPRAHKSVTPALENPVLNTETKRLQNKKAPVPPPAQGGVPTTPVSPASHTLTGQTPGDDEGFAFFDAMKDVAPLSGKGRDVPPEVPATNPVLHQDSNPLQEFMDGKLEFALAFTDEYVEGHVLGLDLMLVGKLQAGQFSPESHLDLHGMNTQQAFDALVGFFRGAYFKGQRTVLVVSGRGLNSPLGVSVLRERVQEWFTQEPLKRVVLAFCTAKPADGGAGALYVLLRKYRKGQGKICWERKPADLELL